MENDEPIEQEFIKTAMLAAVRVEKVEISPTSSGDRYVRIEGQLGDDENADVEWAAFGFLYVIGLLSFDGARPRGNSDIDFQARDQWMAPDLLRHVRYQRGQLSFETDYVRGRMMKTDVTIFPDGRFTLTTTNRGEAPTRWVARIQGKRILAAVSGTRTVESPEE